MSEFNVAPDSAEYERDSAGDMPANGVPADPAPADLEAFWQRAIIRAHINPLSVIMGPSGAESLRPESYALGSTRAEADLLAGLVVTGRKRATSSWRDSYVAEGLPLPEKGQMSIVTDGSGVPRALVQVTEVRLTPLPEVDEAISDAEGEGTLADWRSVHEAAFQAECEDLGITFNPRGSVVTEFIKVLYAGD